MPKRDDQLLTSAAKPNKSPIPTSLEPMMWAHTVLSGDLRQQSQWRSRLEAIRQAQAIDQTSDPKTRAVLANRSAWKQMRTTGKLGASFGLAVSAPWVAWLLHNYAVGWDKGWLASAMYLLPIPIAWKAGRKLWEQASLAGMRDLGNRPSFSLRMQVAFNSLIRAFGAGFGFGFALVFLQCLLTWFHTPAPTLALELFWDTTHGAIGGLIGGAMGMALAPLIGRAMPDPSSNNLLESPGLHALQKDSSA